MHGYIANSIENDPKIDHKTSKSWTRNKDVWWIQSICFYYQRPRNCYEIHSGRSGRKKIYQTPSQIQDAHFVKALLRTLFT